MVREHVRGRSAVRKERKDPRGKREGEAGGIQGYRELKCLEERRNR